MGNFRNWQSPTSGLGAERWVLKMTGSDSSGWLENVSLDFTPGTGEPLRMQIQVATLLCVQSRKTHTHIKCSLWCTHIHTHHTVFAKPNQQAPWGARTGELNSIKLLIWGCVWKWRGSVYCMCACVYRHTQHHVKAHFLSKATPQVLLFKGLSAASAYSDCYILEQSPAGSCVS